MLKKVQIDLYKYEIEPPAVPQNGRRVALVIGAASYRHARELNNTLNDATDFSQRLDNLGFNVTTLLNPSEQQLDSAIELWGKNVEGKDVGLIYFAGHGAEYHGENYIFPIDANPMNAGDFKYTAYPMARILGLIDNSKVKTGIIILDACRNNHFSKNGDRGFSQDEGLANMAVPYGIFLGYAASPGHVASDGNGRNGVYTAAILKYIDRPNITIDELFSLVNKEVRDQTGNEQAPFKNSSLDNQFYLTEATR